MATGTKAACPHAQIKETGLKTPKSAEPSVKKGCLSTDSCMDKWKSLEHVVRAHCSDHKTASGARGSRHKT